jgi:parallel beta-helix repeat protein
MAETSRSFTVDTVAPDTAIVSGPSGMTTSRGPSFSFNSTQAGSSFRCKLDGPGSTAGTWSSCASPTTYSALADGAYVFSAYATDPAGNVDPVPTQRSFSIDATAPDTTISAGPSGTILVPRATFSFASNDSSASLDCRLDGPTGPGSWQTGCVSPRTYEALTNGDYVFNVRARDGAGNADASPATRSFKVVVCHRIATQGSDPAAVYGAMLAGETACFRSGTYGGPSTYISVAKSGVTFRNYPGEYPQIRGRWRLEQTATGATIEGLRLNVDSPDPAATIGILLLGNNQVIRGNDITERGQAGTCVHAARTGWNGPANFAIVDNRIHDCGISNNQQHGVYIDAGSGTIRNNVIFKNADRGLQLYPRAKNVLVESNTIAYNGNGVAINDDVLINGAENLGDATHNGCCSTNNAVRLNVISHSIKRGGANTHPWNVEAPALDGGGNSVSSNCLWGASGDPYYDQYGGVEPGTGTRLNLEPSYPIADPSYRMAVPDDYVLNTTGCGSRGAVASVADPRSFLGGSGPATI